MKFTLIIPFYRNVAMLERQIKEWKNYPGDVKVIVVDDGSPERAAPYIIPLMECGMPIRLFRILKDIPWNRNGARNLGAMKADTDWILQTDIDHVLLPASASALSLFEPKDGEWYRFFRNRVGKADFTRKKDDLPSDCEFGPIKPHMDSYLCRRELYMALGGYDEDYTGGLGGGTPFVKELGNAATRIDLPEPYTLHVHTTDSVPDASDIFLSRDNAHYKRVNAEKRKGAPKKPMCQFDYVEVLI